MTEWIWLNGVVTPLSEAKISVEDRGFQFADGVYEVIRVYSGRPFALAEHLHRLERSAGGVKIDLPLSLTVLSVEIEKLIVKSDVSEGMVYLQLTRGAVTRNHLFPDPIVVHPTLLFYVRSLSPLPDSSDVTGVILRTVADERWKRCWVKSIALLPNVLAKNEVVSRGADEALFVEEGRVSECSASNVHAILRGKLVSPPPGAKVLAGVTREILLRCAQSIGVEIEERAFTMDEALGADELFITSTTRELHWVKRLDDRAIAERVGPITLRLHEEFKRYVQSALHPVVGQPKKARVVFGCR